MKEQLLQRPTMPVEARGLGSLPAGARQKEAPFGLLFPELLPNQNHCSDSAVILLRAKETSGVLGGMPSGLTDSKAQHPAEGYPSSLAASSSASLPAHLVVISLLISTSPQKVRGWGGGETQTQTSSCLLAVLIKASTEESRHGTGKNPSPQASQSHRCPGPGI